MNTGVRWLLPLDASTQGKLLQGYMLTDRVVTLQACWRGDIAVKNFLSAPMLSELAAVEVRQLAAII